MENRIMSVAKIKVQCQTCKKYDFPLLRYKSDFENKNDLDICCSNCDILLFEYREKNNGVSIIGKSMFTTKVLTDKIMTDNKKPMDLEWRLYGLVPYNLSPIQQAIQYGHALQEMNNYVFSLYNGGSFDAEGAEDVVKFCDAFSKWREQDKTFIILNGGTTNSYFSSPDGTPIGSLNNHLIQLKNNNVKVFSFKEEDLQNALTAVVFLVDERVWNKEKYPDFEYDLKVYDEEMEDVMKESWKRDIGGPKNVWLREFLRQFKLA